MLNFRTDTGLQVFRLNPDFVDAGVLFQGLQPPWLLGNMPVSLMVLQFVSLLGTTIPRVREDECLFTMQKLISLIEVVLICGSCTETVCDTPVRASPYVSA